MKMRRRPRPSWLSDLSIGDVLQEGKNGSWRIVRHVTYRKDGQGARAVCLAIRRCSWTRRAYTTLFDTDLITRGFRRVARNAKMSTDIDRQLLSVCAKTIADPDCISCADVRGVA